MYQSAHELAPVLPALVATAERRRGDSAEACAGPAKLTIKNCWSVLV